MVISANLAIPAIEMDADARALARGWLQTAYGPTAVAATPAGVRWVELPRWDGVSDRSNLPGPRVEIAKGASKADPAAQRHLERALTQLDEYFAGARQTFSVALDLVGAPFPRRVWDEVARVPFGQTRSYGEIAAMVGAPAAARAVGRANATNPVAPFVPCHRIVGSDGLLTGYGPGLPMKARLLRMEDALPADAADYNAWIARLAARSPSRAVYLGIRDSRRTRLFCLPGCARARASLTLPPRIFGSLDEAAAAGYTPCPTCAARR
jgi:methylated-DNA-[protein]-cysteine S-methyltransferase